MYSISEIPKICVQLSDVIYYDFITHLLERGKYSKICIYHISVIIKNPIHLHDLR